MVNPNYRVEHVAQVPRGWKVRTKMSATHMLRIAFPPGRRRRGSGKVVEIFHPVNENPCALRNPAKDLGFRRTQTRRDLARFLRQHPKSRRKEIIGQFPGYRRRSNAEQEWPAKCPHCEARFTPAQVEAGEYRKHLAQHRAERAAGKKNRRNPGATQAAAALYESFHGRSPREIVEMQESDAAQHTYTALGDLRELVIDAPAGTVKIGFESSDAVKVASAPGGKQLYFLGGNQNIDGQLGRFGSDSGKDFVELGTAVQLTYRARKSMDNYQSVDYYHDLGEETGEQPLAFYDRLKRRIFLVGGRYRVEAPGIIN